MLVGDLPKPRAPVLARARAEADDPVQDAAALALRGSDNFEPGTDFAAWSHSIVRNRFPSTTRRRRKHAELDGVAAEAVGPVPPPRDDRSALEELARLLGHLPPEIREALLLVAVRGLPYDEVATMQGCAAGTVRSRVFRARHLLRVRLLGGPVTLVLVKTARARAAAPPGTVAS